MLHSDFYKVRQAKIKGVNTVKGAQVDVVHTDK